LNQRRIDKSRQAELKVKELRSLICWKHIAAALKGSLFQVADRTRVPPQKGPSRWKARAGGTEQENQWQLCEAVLEHLLA